MKASFLESTGPSAEIKTELVDDLRPIKKNEIKVEVRAVGLNMADLALKNGKLGKAGTNQKPKIIGSEYSGRVIESRHPEYNKGQDVFGFVDYMHHGTLAEQIIVRPDEIAPMPPSFDFATAACLPFAGATAWQCFYLTEYLKKPTKVFIANAHTDIGLAAAQVAIFLGAKVEATAPAYLHRFLNQVGIKNLYDTETHIPTGGFAVAFDGLMQMQYPDVKKFLNPSGVMVHTMPTPSMFFKASVLKFFSDKRLRPIIVVPRADDIDEIKVLAQRKALQPLLFRKYAWKDVDKAYVKAEKGGYAGKIVVEL